MIDSWDGPPEPTGPVIRRSHYDLPWMLLPMPVQLPVAPPAALRSPVSARPAPERLDGGCELFRLPIRLVE